MPNGLISRSTYGTPEMDGNNKIQSCMGTK